MRTRIVEEARSYVGTRFHHQGRQKGLGVDCAGLLVGVGKALGLIAFDRTDYARQPDPELLLAVCRELGQELPIGAQEPGDVGVFWIRKRSNVTHGGIFSDYHAGGLGLIHTYESVGKVVETALGAWEKRLEAVFRFPGVT